MTPDALVERDERHSSVPWPGVRLNVDPPQQDLSVVSGARPTPRPRVKTKIAEPFFFGSGIFDVTRPFSWQPHSHAEHQFVWPLDGMLTVEMNGCTWSAGPGQGIWIQAGTVHGVSVSSAAKFGLTYLRAGLPNFMQVSSGMTRVPTVVRELFVHLNAQPLPDDARLRCQRVCLDLLEFAGTQTGVPVPSDTRVQPVVNGLLNSPADDRSLVDWADLVHLSSRTLNRILLDEVGMTFSQWRRLLRVRHAESLLATGETVTQASWKVGYTSVSAFIAAFRRITGRTPGEWGNQPALST